MAALLLASAAKASAAEEVPAWIKAEITDGAPILAGLLDVPRVPFTELTYDRAAALPGLLAIDGQAEPQRIVMRFSGDWEEPSPRKRRLLMRNLAHEIAHVAQYTFGHPVENRFLHEGFAEAMAVEALTECGPVCGNVGRVRQELESACGDALRDGILASLRTRPALYGCGAVLALAAGEVTGLGARGVYRELSGTDRSEAALLDIIEKAAGERFALSARRFLFSDHTLARPSSVIGRLRAGRL